MSPISPPGLGHNQGWGFRADSALQSSIAAYGKNTGGPTPLGFVTTCDNGIFNGGVIYAPLKNNSLPICRYKATLTYFLAPYIYL